MTPDLQRLIPDIPADVRNILDPGRGPLDAPIRSEIFGRERFAQHGRSLGETHRAEAGGKARRGEFFPRLRENIRTLREAHAFIGEQARTGYQVSPAAEWLLDNFHLIESQLDAIHGGLPRRYFRRLPTLIDEPLAGLPRVYGVAWAFVAHTDGAFDDDLLEHYLKAYQETRALDLGELWALPTTLRVVLIENLRRLAERLACNKAAREVANLVCDHLDHWTTARLDALLALLNQRSVGRTFLVQMAQRLEDHRASTPNRPTGPRDWLYRHLPDLAAVQAQHPAELAADNLSVSNSIGALRAIDNADWPTLVCHCSATIRLLLSSPTFEAERSDTRDVTLHAIERLALLSGRPETEIARTLLELMQRGHPDGSVPSSSSSQTDTRDDPSHWLHGPGRHELLERLDLHDNKVVIWHRLRRHAALPVYLATLAAGTLGLVAWVLTHHAANGSVTPSLWLMLASAALMTVPASEAIVALINRLISESTRPSHLPRLALAHGIPPEHRVLVVIPGLLSGLKAVNELVHRLELHYLANPEQNAQFALLTDWVDADTPTRSDDAELLAAAQRRIELLNARYPRLGADGSEPARNSAAPAPRFTLLHRPRVFSETQQRWIGWERKRGKLEQLIARLANPQSRESDAAHAFIDLGELSRIEAGTPYVVTLDGDTQLPPGRLRELVGVAAHPHNQPVVDTVRRIVSSGYGILQPRVDTPLPAPEQLTLYHWLFAGRCGIDPYSTASSEVYQDLFREGSFSGKGLLNVRAMDAVLSHRLPEGAVLSHDLLEGSIARCAAVTDINVIEDAPFHADVAAARQHRWTRGDWQLLPFLARSAAYPMRAINRWKMIDSLRRSLVAPAALALIVLSLASKVVSPGAALALVFGAFTAGPLMGAIAGFAPAHDRIALRHFYRAAFTDLRRVIGSGVWQMAQLLSLALAGADAVVRAVFRLAVSRRGLLEWTTAAASEASATLDLAALARRHAVVSIAALLIWLGLLAFGTPFPALAFVLCAIWAASPFWVWWVSRPVPRRNDEALPAADQAKLEALGRDTWRLFERCVTAEDNFLPPDNLQLTPQTLLAHRTSPTNIGLYLLSTACARQFGWIGTQDLLERFEATLATLLKLPRHRGHLVNWIDTQSLAPLLPMYVSTVDSGNLSGHLLAVAQACRELARAPHDSGAVQHALHASRQRLAPMLAALPEQPDDALKRLLTLPDPLAAATRTPDSLDVQLHHAADLLSARMPDDAAALTPNPANNFVWRAADHLATIRSALRDVRASALDGASAGSTPSDTSLRLNALAARFEALAWEPDYSFLYDRKRHLFHIGYRVVEQQLDASYYDLLASESRLTSLLAIAKGDVPVAHWAALGRPFYAVGSRAGLRSWSGSMFEYLMPTLVLDEPHGSVLNDAGHAALREQIAYGHEQHLPWGISESAYAASDHTLAYQYAPQGVPRLALRRTPRDELVVAPYATALAAQIAPHGAVANFNALEARGSRSRYGFIEALDFTPARQSTPKSFVPVSTFMAHHQGMSIVSIANLLLNAAPRRWGMGNAHVQAVASLLHERAPREVPVLNTPPLSPSLGTRQSRTPGLLRDVLPGVTALAPTQLLSNGRYSVTLRANGAGWSRWGGVGINRWRDDALRDACGSFFYVRWDRQPQAVSLTQHPAPDPAAHYKSTYHADRVSFDTSWPEFETTTTVWVSPEDDVEIRQVDLRNLGDRPLELELMSAFEITLADPKADESHPAFSNLFLRAQWNAAQQALVFERKPRLAGDPAHHAAHFLVESVLEVGTPLSDLRVQTKRLGWHGRNHDVGRPLASFPAVAAPASASSGAAPVELETGLDPMCAFSVRVQLPPNSKARLTFCTAAADSPATLHAVIDKYRQPLPIARASLMSATLNGIRMRDFKLGADTLVAIQTLSTAILLTVTRPRPSTARNEAVVSAHPDDTAACDRRSIWRLGISGDRPIVLVMAGAPQGIGLLRALSQALRLWSWAGIGCDLVVVNAEPTSYLMALQRDVSHLREDFDASNAGHPGAALTRFHVLRADELSALELTTLRALARVRLNADGRPLTHHMSEWAELHERAMEERLGESIAALPIVAIPADQVRRSQGRFAPVDADADRGEFRFDVSMFKRPARPWVNVLANPGFGTQVSEAGGGYTWALNSRMNMLTPWSNDPVADTPGEWFLLQDLKTRELWSVAPSIGNDPGALYRVTHGQGYTGVRHRRGELDVETRYCVDATRGVKQIVIHLTNRGSRTMRLRAIGIAEWVMGGSRGERNTTTTAMFTQRLPAAVEAAEADAAPAARSLLALTCTQRDRAGGFGEGTAFLALAGDTHDDHDWTTDRRECFDARGRLAVPDHFGGESGAGLDPCAALSTRITLAAGESTECVFLLGFGENPLKARELATRASTVPPAQRVAEARAVWDELLGASTVRTPDPLFDALVNRWLLYQTVACRMWAKAGFYQAGGAFGFRDQLQDALALTWSAPKMVREQIVLNASRQFAAGDVQHWWHAPTGAGVRTHFSDDLLWLPYACALYVSTTGDSGVLDERVPFIDGGPIPDGAEDAYYVPDISSVDATVYEHAARAIDRSLKHGVHGLPLMGSGDWNDGMNRVGIEGRGESVWLAWFLCKLIEDFAPIAEARGETQRVQRWHDAALVWRTALKGDAWDGAWFRRAFFDDGTPLGSQVNTECRIDLIAQAWSVMSGMAAPALQRIAMNSLAEELVDNDAGLLKLLAPPLQSAQPSAGYIQAYPPGVRENGGQYSHAGVWALIAQAMGGNGDAAYRYFTYLSPAHRSAHPDRGEVYEIEPYVMAGDVYGAAPYLGRGGWSWYTGSAGWLHRAALENMFGMQLRGDEIAFTPCLPSHWDHAELTLRRAKRTLRVMLCRGDAAEALERARSAGAIEKTIGAEWRWNDAEAPECVLLRLPAPTVADAARLRPTQASAGLRWAGDQGLPTVQASTPTH